MLCINALSQVVFFHPFPLKRRGGGGGGLYRPSLLNFAN